MKTSHKVAAAFFTMTALASCAADAEVEDDSPQENITTDTAGEESEDSESDD